MEIAVLGGGHGCYAAAADLSQKGHRVRFWRRNLEAFEPVLRSGGVNLIDYKGERSVPIHLVTNVLSEAIKDAQIVVVPLPAFSHEDLFHNLAPLLIDGQIVYLPPGTFGTYILAKAMRSAGNSAKVKLAETGTLPYLARKHSSDTVVVSAYATRLPTGVFPARDTETVLQTLEGIYPVERCEDTLSGALMNAGPIIHTPLIIMNAAPLEHFDTWDIHNEGTQSSVRRVTTELDNERIKIRELLGYSAPHFPLADHYDPDRSGEEWMYGRAAHGKLTDSGDWRESIDLKAHRYMLEDARLGLSFLTSISRWLGFSAPIIEGLLAISSIVAEIDLYKEGRTFENLGLSKMKPEELKRILFQGLDSLEEPGH